MRLFPWRVGEAEMARVEVEAVCRRVLLYSNGDIHAAPPFRSCLPPRISEMDDVVPSQKANTRE